MRVLDGEQILMRLFLGESQRWRRQPLYKALVEMFRREHLAGATVFRGIAGFGATSHYHTAQLLRLSQDLPIVVEVVDSQENIDRVLPEVDRMMNAGLLTLEKVRVLRYAPTSGPAGSGERGAGGPDASGGGGQPGS